MAGLRRLRTLTLTILSAILLLYALLLIPEPAPDIPAAPDRRAFAWNRNTYWESLETAFQQARQIDCTTLRPTIAAGLDNLRSLQSRLEPAPVPADAVIWDSIQAAIFEIAPLLGACPESIDTFQSLTAELRQAVKTSARAWDLDNPDVRALMYRLLYGSRIAVEEILLQMPDSSRGTLFLAADEPSTTPSAQLLDITIHSGDILISRGGAPTSALIARGNDFPGNFSHIALVHVDSATSEISIVESHIECGVAIATSDQYLSDTKLRVLALRLRADLPALITDPMLPHRVATSALDRARREHIPYDFPMDFADSSALFCSEVASYPYRQHGIDLWMGMSHMSGAGLRSWLAAFGVENFETQAPSDLEYDPQLRVVAEWRDPQTLYQDHVDNAILDALQEQAERDGRRLEYDWYMLPFGRLLKAYSVVLNCFDGVGPIPEGMSAASALRNDRFSTRHARIKTQVMNLAADFERQHGYRPPYWELVKLARRTVTSQQP